MPDSQAPAYCRNCGAKLAADARYCEKCGVGVDVTFGLNPTGGGSSAPYTPPAAPPQAYSAPPPPPARSGAKPWIIGGLACFGIVGLLVCAALVGGGVIFWQRVQGPISEAATFVAPLGDAQTALPQVETIAAQAATVVAEATFPPIETFLPLETLMPQTTPVPGTPFTGGPITFTYDPALAREITVETVPAASGADLPYWEIGPEHTVLTLEGYPVTSRPAQIFVYPLQPYYSMNEGAAAQIDALTMLLQNRPTGADLPEDLPFLPLYNAAQVFSARVIYLDFDGGSGVAYLTQYAQDAYPIHNNALFYTFQGITTDQQYVISAVMPVTNPLLPDPEPIVTDPGFYDNFRSYLETTTGLLDAAPGFTYAPSLDTLDDLFRSIQVE